MNKPYKVAYKTYFNDRLKQVLFHDLETYPLYIQVTYRRKSMFFKSYYFDLLSKRRYEKRVKLKTLAPTLEHVITLEQEALGFIVKTLPEDFTLNDFKIAYDFYTKDLCTETELAMRVHMFMFFADKNATALGNTIVRGERSAVLYEVMADMERFFKPDIYRQLIQSALSGSQPYLHLYAFMLHAKKWPLLILSVIEWETGNTKSNFKDFLLASLPEQECIQVIKAVEKWVVLLK